MFQFPGFPPHGLCVQPRGDGSSCRRVSPFGHHRLIAYTRLPDAFRSVSRPSSAPDAQASPVRLLALVSSYRDRIPATLFLALVLVVCDALDVYSLVKVRQPRMLASLTAYVRVARDSLEFARSGASGKSPGRRAPLDVQVGLTRLERVTSPLSEECSNRLSYRPGQPVKSGRCRYLRCGQPIVWAAS